MAIITVNGKRWFERTNGNTYHSVDVYVDGELIGREPFTYGYGDGYKQTALDILTKVRPDIAGDVTVLWHLRDKGHKIITSVADVARKKDL